MSSTASTETKIPIRKFLEIMTNNKFPVNKAIAAAGKIYKDYNTASKLNFLTDHALKTANIEDAGDRKLILAAFRKAGYKPQSQALNPSKRKTGEAELEDEDASPLAKSAALSTAEAGPSRPSPASNPDPLSTPTKSPAAKRRRTVDKMKNEFLPDAPDSALGEVVDPSAVDFHEVLDEGALQHKHVVVNRAPVMTAWATIVAERLGFKRTEALSIASVYTDMNALSKGASLGKNKKGQSEQLEASRHGSQPYVELMGRRVPLIHTQSSEWRALSHSSPVSPLVPHGYISRSLRQNTPYVIGALRLLAESYSVDELKEKAWILYTMFRPQLDEWGKKSEVSCERILGLRKQRTAVGEAEGQQNKEGESKQDIGNEPGIQQMSLEEFEAALEGDHALDDVDLDFMGQSPSN